MGPWRLLEDLLWVFQPLSMGSTETPESSFSTLRSATSNPRVNHQRRLSSLCRPLHSNRDQQAPVVILATGSVRRPWTTTPPSRVRLNHLTSLRHLTRLSESSSKRRLQTTANAALNSNSIIWSLSFTPRLSIQRMESRNGFKSPVVTHIQWSSEVARLATTRTDDATAPRAVHPDTARRNGMVAWARTVEAGTALEAAFITGQGRLRASIY